MTPRPSARPPLPRTNPAHQSPARRPVLARSTVRSHPAAPSRAARPLDRRGCPFGRGGKHGAQGPRHVDAATLRGGEKPRQVRGRAAQGGCSSGQQGARQLVRAAHGAPQEYTPAAASTRENRSSRLPRSLSPPYIYPGDVQTTPTVSASSLLPLAKSPPIDRQSRRTTWERRRACSSRARTRSQKSTGTGSAKTWRGNGSRCWRCWKDAM